MKTLIYFISFFVLTSSSDKKLITYSEMKSDMLMSDFFTNAELKDLAEIVDFFEKQIFIDKRKSKEECYYSFNKSIIEQYMKERKDFKSPLNYHLQKKLYTRVDSSFLREIWVHPSYFTGKNFKNKMIKKSYNLNLFGKYVLFLKSLKNDDTLFEDFYTMFNATNTISLATQAATFYRFESKEFKGIKRRLFFSIYYLTINDKFNNYKSHKK